MLFPNTLVEQFLLQLYWYIFSDNLIATARVFKAKYKIEYCSRSCFHAESLKNKLIKLSKITSKS